MSGMMKHFANDGVEQITSEEWELIHAGDLSTALKYFAQNAGDRTLEDLIGEIAAVGTTDGSGMARFALESVTVMPPYGAELALGAPSGGGTWGSTGLKYYMLTAYNGTGETQPCDEASINVDDTTKKVTLTWETVAGASGYKVYRTTTPGDYGASSLRATVSGGSSDSYEDDGGALSSGTPPTANTTAGPAPGYGTPPTLNTSPIDIGDLEIGQYFAYWVNWVVPNGTPEDGNPRLFTIDFSET
jgi:hypothetical protein